ncbi:hypothetical protein Aperf_G00000101389 [Anoplocephala perfoliata]
MDLNNNSYEWNPVLAIEHQQQYRSTVHSPEKLETGCLSALENPRLESGPYINDILREEGDEVEFDSAIPFRSNSPKKIQDSSDSSLTELPQPHFLPTTVQESSSAPSSSSSQIQATICRDNVVPDSTLLRKSMEKMRSRARSSRFGPTIPLNDAEQRKAQQLFTMDVEDNIGQTAFAWCNWITDHVATRTCIAKDIRDALIRFTLPANLQELEGLKVIHYLENFCFIGNERMVLYEALYSKVRQMEFSLASLREAISRLIPQQFENEVDELISLLDLPPRSSLGQNVFSGQVRDHPGAPSACCPVVPYREFRLTRLFAGFFSPPGLEVTSSSIACFSVILPQTEPLVSPPILPESLEEEGEPNTHSRIYSFEDPGAVLECAVDFTAVAMAAIEKQLRAHLWKNFSVAGSLIGHKAGGSAIANANSRVSCPKISVQPTQCTVTGSDAAKLVRREVSSIDFKLDAEVKAARAEVNVRLTKTFGDELLRMEEQ